MVSGSAIIELLNERLNSIKHDNYYTQGIKSGIQEAIDIIELAETMDMKVQAMEVAHV